MIRFERIWAVVLRHLYLISRDLSRLSWMFYWPAFDIITWGFAGYWVQQNSSSPVIAYTQLLSLVLLQLVGRTAFESSIVLIEELWSMNMLNLFATPITLPEWICATFILGAISNSILLAYCMFIVWLVFGITFFSIGWPIIFFIIPLIISGIWIGFTASTLVIHYGARAQTFVFIFNWLFTPFCGVFYPVEVLPGWGQTISYSIPMTYVFNALRIYVASNIIEWQTLLIGYALALFYAVCAITLFCYAFSKSKEKGLARLTAE